MWTVFCSHSDAKNHPVRIESMRMKALAASVHASLSPTPYYNLNERGELCKWGRADFRLNKPAFQLSAVIDWHSSGIPHFSSSMKGKGEILYFLVTWRSMGVNHLPPTQMPWLTNNCPSSPTQIYSPLADCKSGLMSNTLTLSIVSQIKFNTDRAIHSDSYMRDHQNTVKVLFL